MEDAIKSLKEFIWDIIGYLIPGFLLVIILNLLTNPSIAIQNKFIIDWKTFGNYIIVVISYILGYVVYSLTMFKITIQDILINSLIKIKTYFDQTWLQYISSNPIVNPIFDWIKTSESRHWVIREQTSSTFKNAKDFLKRNQYTDVDSMKFNEVRNIMMSRNPDMDQKIYTFMFRSSLFDHLSTLGILVVLLISGDKLFNLNVIKNESAIRTLPYIILPLIPMLGKCKRLFYSIAQRIPLSNLK